MAASESGLNRAWAIPAALLLTVLVAAACTSSDTSNDSAGDNRLRVVTSLELFADMVRNVAGERAEVTALLPAGADPHTYELSPGRVVDVAQADLAFVNGLGLEGSLLTVIDENAGGPVDVLTDGLDIVDGNPHLWLDPMLAISYVQSILLALAAADPDGASEYAANAAAYADELLALDAEIEAALASIPPERRKLVTFHDAYPYLASRYGLEVYGRCQSCRTTKPLAAAGSESNDS